MRLSVIESGHAKIMNAAWWPKVAVQRDKIPRHAHERRPSSPPWRLLGL
jgi:hypothetical protein